MLTFNDYTKSALYTLITPYTISELQYGTVLPTADQQQADSFAPISQAFPKLAEPSPALAPHPVPNTAPTLNPSSTPNAETKLSTKDRLSYLERTVASLKLKLENFILETRVSLSKEEEDEVDEDEEEEDGTGTPDDDADNDDDDEHENSSEIDQIIAEVNSIIDDNKPC